MPLTDNFLRVPLSQIKVDRANRQRRDLEIDEGFKQSILQRGVINPIIVNSDYELIAGERRLETSRLVGLLDIPVRFAESLTPAELSIIELEENLRRRDLGWKDLVNSIGLIHKIHLSLDHGWTIEETGDSIGLNKSAISMYLRVHEQMSDIKIAASSGVREAYNILVRRDQRLAGEALHELIEVADEMLSPIASRRLESALANPIANDNPRTSSQDLSPRPPASLIRPPSETILNQSFLQWAPQYVGPKFNLIHCDFPYGINVFNGPQGGLQHTTNTYDDTEDLYFLLLRCLCENLNRLMSVSGHLLFWYSAKHEIKTREIFRELAPSLDFTTHPLIWFKSDNTGIVADARREARHVYETCLMARRGDRFIVQTKADCYPSPTNRSLHPSAKPEPMLKHFMTMLVDTNTTLLDPTCGSANALLAAEGLGAKHILGLEIDPEMCEVARLHLGNSRLLRSASKLLSEEG